MLRILRGASREHHAYFPQASDLRAVLPGTTVFLARGWGTYCGSFHAGRSIALEIPHRGLLTSSPCMGCAAFPSGFCSSRALCMALTRRIRPHCNSHGPGYSSSPHHYGCMLLSLSTRILAAQGRGLALECFAFSVCARCCTALRSLYLISYYRRVLPGCTRRCDKTHLRAEESIHSLRSYSAPFVRCSSGGSSGPLRKLQWFQLPGRTPRRRGPALVEFFVRTFSRQCGVTEQCGRLPAPVSSSAEQIRCYHHRERLRMSDIR